MTQAEWDAILTALMKKKAEAKAKAEQSKNQIQKTEKPSQ